MKSILNASYDCNTSTDQQCTDQEYRKYIYSNPEALWDIFPCPPPWKPELILELPWKEKLGDEDGDRLCKRVARRCGLDLVKLQAMALQDALIFSDCDLKCFIGLLLGFLTLCLCVVIVVIFFRRRKKKFSKVPDHKNETQVILTSNGVQTKLMNGESSSGENSSPEKRGKYGIDFARFCRSANVYESDEVKRHRSDISENAFLSAGDMSYTYDSVNTSEQSFSNNMSNSFENHRFNEEMISELREKYGFRNSESASVHEPRSVNTPVSNLLYDMRSPNPTVSNALYQARRQCEASSIQSTNQIPLNCPCNICCQSNSSIPYRGQVINLKQNYSVQRQDYPVSCKCYPRGYPDEHKWRRNNVIEKFPYADDVINSSVQNHSFYDREQGASDFRINSACSCKQCVEQRLSISEEDYSTYSTGSDVYGVPNTDLNYPREIQCNCRQCTKMIPIAAYTKRFSQTEEYTQRDNVDMQFMSAGDIIDSDGPEHRKRRRSKQRPPISSTASSSDNTGSEKSFRSGKMKTNGSLFNSKLISR
ncbi:uncharacterized protein LOC133175345 isoform X2 [Saccostrea echinata]|uniref:uncharacterized protein LOC133175345 isoform X2 n=1 Tax=Saccostrea echinata TaxID=191078 RepID=UPI002A8030CA|nr:uncharacterized protein LOC133175345 isoform X2 [Saccostrea echinata]